MDDIKNKIIDLATSEDIDFKSNYLDNEPIKQDEQKEEYRWFFWLHELGKKLEDEHKISVVAYPHEDKNRKFVYKIVDELGLIVESIKLFDSYEKAYESGILHCLEYTIKILKNDKQTKNDTNIVNKKIFDTKQIQSDGRTLIVLHQNNDDKEGLISQLELMILGIKDDFDWFIE